jgi:two-component system sensor histidine kinase KdpD
VQAFGFSAGALFVQAPDVRELREEAVVGAEPGAIVLRGDPGVSRTEERLPLSVGGRNLGLLVLKTDRDHLSPAESRVLRAFCDQFALVLERDRLLRAATETEVLRQTDRTRRALLDAVSHDLRSPLAAIKASVTDLLGTDAEHGLAETKEALESIDAETDRLSGLIANLLDMSRIEQGTIVPRLHVVDVGEAINAAVDRTRYLRSDLRFSVDLAADPSLVRADPVFLGRVLANLLDNAVKATADDDTAVDGHDVSRPLEVVVRQHEGRTTVRIVDHGPGVPPDAKEQLFYPFYQLSDRHPRHGTGLGLAICRGFLSLMDGEIWIEETPGGGATFAFSLPTAEAGG